MNHFCSMFLPVPGGTIASPTIQNYGETVVRSIGWQIHPSLVGVVLV